MTVQPTSRWGLKAVCKNTEIRRHGQSARGLLGGYWGADITASILLALEFVGQGNWEKNSHFLRGLLGKHVYMLVLREWGRGWEGKGWLADLPDRGDLIGCRVLVECYPWLPRKGKKDGSPARIGWPVLLSLLCRRQQEQLLRRCKRNGEDFK